MSYSESYFTARESWRDWRIEAQQLIHLARVSFDTRVLEIGCGGGGLLRLLRERGAWTVGVDTLQVALQVASDKWQETITAVANKESMPPRMTHVARHLPFVRIGEDGSLPFRDAAFDTIVGQHVIEHLPDADVALREWKRLLTPNGLLALATPNADYPDPAHFADADHTRIFSPRELSDAAVRAGFAIEACYTVFPFLTRVRALRVLSVVAYRAFQRVPYFATRGRTIILGARKPEDE